MELVAKTELAGDSTGGAIGGNDEYSESVELQLRSTVEGNDTFTVYIASVHDTFIAAPVLLEELPFPTNGLSL